MSIFNCNRIKIGILIEGNHKIETWSLTLNFVALWFLVSTCLTQISQLVEAVDSVVAIMVSIGLVTLLSIEGRWKLCYT